MIFENSFLLFKIFAAPQSLWLITISLFILCNLIEVFKLSQKGLCHFLNLFAVTPIAAPAIEKNCIYHLIFFYLNSCKLSAGILDQCKTKPLLYNLISLYSTVTDLAKFLGLSISQFLSNAT